jgi:hypothetical protein
MSPRYGVKMREMLVLLEDLEKSYTEMMHMFMNTSRRLLENAAFVKAMAEATKDVDGDDLRRLEAVKGRLRAAAAAVQEDFARQTQQIVESPLFSAGIKDKVREIQESNKRLAEGTDE